MGKFRENWGNYSFKNSGLLLTNSDCLGVLDNSTFVISILIPPLFIYYNNYYTITILVGLNRLLFRDSITLACKSQNNKSVIRKFSQVSGASRVRFRIKIQILPRIVGIVFLLVANSIAADDPVLVTGWDGIPAHGNAGRARHTE